MKSSEKVILEKMIGYCDDIVSFLKKFNDSYEIYRSEKMLQYACNTCIIQIGELSARLSDDFKESHKEIPWRIVKATRNFYAHDYERVDLAVMWQTLTNDIPELFTKTGQNLKYAKESFEEYSVLNSYENIILETIKKNREDFRFGKYDFGKSKKGTVNSNIPTFNTYDVDPKDFFSQLEASNKVLISPEHPTLRSTTDNLQRKITAKENEIASKESEIHKLSDEIKRLQGELSTSKKTAADLKSDYERKIRELSKKKKTS